MAINAIRVPSSGGYVATENASAADETFPASSPAVIQASEDDPSGAFPLFGTGGYIATASGSGTASDPWVPAVAVSGAGLALPIQLPAGGPYVFQVDTNGDMTLAGTLTVLGSSSLDNGEITTDGSGNLTIGGSLAVVNASSLDNGGITTDGSGNLTATSVILGNTVLTSDSFQGLICSGAITPGAGYAFSSSNPVPCNFGFVPMITTSTIADPIAQAAVQALCTALGIPTA